MSNLTNYIKLIMNKDMTTPKTRAEFERNLNLLQARLVNNKISFAKGISTEGLLQVRFLPNRRIDFLSVDESTRLHANTIANLGSVDTPEVKTPGDSAGASDVTQ
jgi:hypothetical protein